MAAPADREQPVAETPQVAGDVAQVRAPKWRHANAADSTMRAEMQGAAKAFPRPNLTPVAEIIRRRDFACCCCCCR